MEQDIGQCLWVGYEEPEPSDVLLGEVERDLVGAVILFARNIPKDEQGNCDVAELRRITTLLHQRSSQVWIAVDQEGGLVQRVRAPLPHWPQMMNLANQPVDVAAQVGLAIGQELAWLGFDIDFAPVLDVHTNEANPIIGKRAFGREPRDAAARALAFANGLGQAGILPCGKHFPGHGDTDVDSHLALPVIHHDRGRLDAVELVPFQMAIEAKLEMFMTAHIKVPVLDADVPATLSRTIISGLLREELGFEGLIVSDDLEMKALANHYRPGESAELALRAGCDVLLLCKLRHMQTEVRQHLLGVCEADPEFAALVDVAAKRVRAAKAKHQARDISREAPDLPAHHALCQSLR